MGNATAPAAPVIAPRSEVRFEPLHDYVLVAPIKQSTTMGGIALPDNAKLDPPRCKVVKIGYGMLDAFGNLHPIPFSVGDEVFVADGSDVAVMYFSGHEYLLVRACDVIGKVPRDEASPETAT